MEILKMPPRPGAPRNEQPVIPQGNTPAMEVAHVLFMDVVGFSQLRMQQQANIQVELQNLVQSTVEVQQARKENKLIVRPTGDGMALLFLRDLLSPVRCALQLQTLIQNKDGEIRQRTGAPIRLRMGIHSGSVLLVEDMNAQSDVAGEGIITAQRVMDCGDAGHILLSDDVAKKILNVDPWQRYLTNLGEVRVKHGVKVHLYNLYGRLDGPYCGNPSTPKKVQEDSNAQAQEAKKYRGTFFERNPGAKRFLTTGLVCGVLVGGGYALWTKVPAVKAAYVKFTTPSKPAEPVKNGKPASGNTGNKKTAHTSHGGGSGNTNGAYAGMSERRTATVPDLIGRTVDDAKSAAREQGLRLVTRGSQYSQQYGEGQICVQKPAFGANLTEGGTIYITISKGEPHAESTPDPDTTEPTPDPAPSPEAKNGGDGGDGGQTTGTNDSANNG